MDEVGASPLLAFGETSTPYKIQTMVRSGVIVRVRERNGFLSFKRERAVVLVWRVSSDSRELELCFQHLGVQHLNECCCR